MPCSLRPLLALLRTERTQKKIGGVRSRHATQPTTKNPDHVNPFPPLHFTQYLNSGGMQHICAAPVGDGQLLVPEGWHDYLGACPDTCYTDCNYNLNGKSTSFTNASYEHGSNYGTSVIGNQSVAFAKRAMNANWPFFAMVASHAPHGPATPAPWYAQLYSGDDVIAPRTPAFNVSSPDKHWVVATQPTLTDEYASKKIDAFYKNRLRSLRSVDDIVADMYAAVEEAGQLNQTYFIFTSDHGLHMGQFNLGPCKRQPYETDLRIPFFITGPNVKSGALLPAVAGIVDIAPTILELAGAGSAGGAGEGGALPLDGHSLVPLITEDGEDGTFRDAYLIEYFATSGVVTKVKKGDHLKDNSNNTFIGLRVQNETNNFAFFEFTDAVDDWDFKTPDFCEAYDLDADPHQLHNICAKLSAPARAAWHQQLRDEYACSEGSCR